jgi:hypothetical protein
MPLEALQTAMSMQSLDGNFYVRFSLDVRTGEGTQWHVETYGRCTSTSWRCPLSTLSTKPIVTQSMPNVPAQISEMGGLVAVAHVQPGQPVLNDETREAVAIRTLVAARDPASGSEGCLRS